MLSGGVTASGSPLLLVENNHLLQTHLQRFRTPPEARTRRLLAKKTSPKEIAQAQERTGLRMAS